MRSYSALAMTVRVNRELQRRVKQAFVDLFCKHTGASAADGTAWLAGLVTSHRYLEDIWASSAPVGVPA